MATDRLKGNLDLLLLGTLAGGPAHGYAIVRALREQSGGTFDLPEGTVYPALHALEQRGLLEASWSMAEGRRRKRYSLTPRGRAEYARERQAWASFSAAVELVTGGPAWQT